MDLLVFNKMWPLAKALSTIQTFKRFFTCVNSLVADEVSSLAESFPTVQAFVWFLPGVDALVSKKIPSPGKYFPTSNTFIWVFSRSYFMPNIVWPLIECIFYCVNPLMFKEV